MQRRRGRKSERLAQRRPGRKTGDINRAVVGRGFQAERNIRKHLQRKAFLFAAGVNKLNPMIVLQQAPTGNARAVALQSNVGISRGQFHFFRGRGADAFQRGNR